MDYSNKSAYVRVETLNSSLNEISFVEVTQMCFFMWMLWKVFVPICILKVVISIMKSFSVWNVTTH